MPSGKYPRTDFHGKRISEGKYGAFHRHSTETREKISAALKNYKLLKKSALEIGNAKEASQTEPERNQPSR